MGGYPGDSDYDGPVCNPEILVSHVWARMEMALSTSIECSTESFKLTRDVVDQDAILET